MPLGVVFWILMLLWLVLGAWGFTSPDQRTPARMGFGLLLFLLLAVIGWRLFGPVVQ